jgi:hypothetical protein
MVELATRLLILFLIYVLAFLILGRITGPTVLAIIVVSVVCSVATTALLFLGWNKGDD